MKSIRLTLILILVILVSCTNKNIHDSHFIPNKELSEAYKDFTNNFKKKRNTLLFIGGGIATNCQTYQDMATKYEIDETINNQITKSEYLICDALKILSTSSKISGENIGILNRGEELLSKLDLRSFPSSLNRASDENAYTLKSLYPQQAKYVGNVAELNIEDWSFILEVVAVTRINDNATLDWIVWVVDESKQGNYRGYSTLIVYDPENQDNFKAIKYP